MSGTANGLRAAFATLGRRLRIGGNGKPTIGLVGYFGWGNYGDELFVQVWQQELGDEFNLRVLPDVQAKPYFSRGIDAALRGVDAILIGGGDLVIPWQLSELYWRREYLRLPVFIAGVGVPTSQPAKPNVVQRLHEFFSHPNVRFIHARDPESQQWIENHLAPAVHVHEGPDLACAIDFPPHIEGKGNVLGIVTREIRRHRDRGERSEGDSTAEQQYDDLRSLAQQMHEHGYHIRHIVLGAGKIGEDDLADAHWAALPHAQVMFSESIDDMTRMIADCSALVTMKFHGAVVATMYRIPSFNFVAPGKPVSAKRVNFIRRINRADLVEPLSAADCAQRILQGSPIAPESVTMLRETSLAVIAKLRASLLESLVKSTPSG